ncbi:hypothetical protein U1Q18_023625, partial [Sarracenia purpurea var. burkii]
LIRFGSSRHWSGHGVHNTTVQYRVATALPMQHHRQAPLCNDATPLRNATAPLRGTVVVPLRRASICIASLRRCTPTLSHPCTVMPLCHRAPAPFLHRRRAPASFLHLLPKP